MKFLKNENYKEILIVFIISIIFPIILLNKIIFSSGYILFWDFELPVYSDRFVDYHILIWDSLSSSPGIENIGRLFARLPFIILSYMEIDVGIIEKLMFISLYSIGMLSSYFFLKKIINLEHKASLLLSLAYVMFIHFFQYIYQYSAIFGGMILPAIFSFFYLGINNRNVICIIFSSILIATTVQMPFTFFSINLLILFYVMFMIILRNMYNQHILKSYSYFLLIQICIESFYLLPLFVNLPTPESMTSNIVTYEEIIRYSDRESFIYPLTGFTISMNKFQLIWSYYSDEILKNLQLIVSIIFLIILPFLTSILGLIKNKTKISMLNIFFSITLLILWQLALGNMGIFGSLYTSAVTELSILNFLRSSQKFYVLIPFFTIGLVSMLFKSIKNNRLQISLSGLFLISMIFISFPSIVSWNNNLEPVQVPKEFDDVQEIIKNNTHEDNEYFRTVWFPEYKRIDTVWSKFLLPFEQRSSVIPIYSYYRSGYRQYFILINYVWQLFTNGKTELASKYLNRYGVKYIIFHNDIIYKEDKLRFQEERILSSLLFSDDFELKYHKGFIYLFENKNYVGRGYFSTNSYKPVLLESIALQKVINSNDIYGDYFFLDDGFKGMWDVYMLSKNIIITNYSNYIDNLVYYRSLYQNRDYYYYPGKHTFHDNQKEFWSVKSGWEINPKFNTYVRTYIDKNFSEYSLDFGQRIITTSGNNITAKYNVNINNDNNISNRYIFLIRYFENIKGGNIEIRIDEKSYIINSKSDTNKFIWKKLDNVDLESNGHYISVRNIEGYNAINVFGLIPEEEYNRTVQEIIDIMKDKRVIYISDSGSQNFTYHSLNEEKFEIPLIISSRNILDIKDHDTKLSFNKIDSSSWKININATDPFMLSSLETYDPQWQAEVYRNDKKIKEIGAIPLYSMINGFWIDDVGNLTIIVKYKLQKWYDIGLIISIFTIICCIGYTIYTKEKET